MFSLLNYKVWGAIALAIFLSFSGGTLYGDHRRGHLDELETTAKIATANEKARNDERAKQIVVDNASKVATTRETKILADAANARVIVGGLRGDLNALKLASQKSLSASQQALNLTTELFDRCTSSYLGVAEAAQRADTEARELREAWPQ
jgi:hypothetical protein